MAGTTILVLLVATFLLFSKSFTNLALEQALHAFSEDIRGAISVSESGQLVHDDDDITRKWGLDNLYANIGFRVVDVVTGEEVLRSASQNRKGALIDMLPTNLPDGFTLSANNEIAMFRADISVEGNRFYLDLVRSDRLADLANEAVLPAIINFAFAAMVFSFLLFLCVSFFSVKYIVNLVAKLSEDINLIKPENLSTRLPADNLPNELVPIVNSFNVALSRVEMAFEQQQRFVANAAHELRTPLAVLLSRLELSMTQSQLKTELIDDTQYLNRIVEQLLDLSRISKDIETHRHSRVDLIPLTADTISRLAPLALDQKHDIEFVAQVPSTIITADEGEMMIVVKNLVENAIRHTPSNGQIVVTVAEKYLCVEDSGPGISHEHRDRVFERFWRAEQSSRNGSGLGLSISKEILTLHRAHISVQKSLKLGGARFDVNFSK